MKPRLFVLLVLGAAGCDRPPARSASTGGSAVAAAAPTVQAEGRANGAGADSIQRVDTIPHVDTIPGRPAPAIREACGAFSEIFGATAAASGISPADIVVSPDTAMRFGGTGQGPVEPACQVVWDDSRSHAVPLNDVFARARAAGWTERDRLLMADGPDGSVLAVSRESVACLVSGSWDGDDDSDSTYVPSPGFQIAASCFANRADRY